MHYMLIWRRANSARSLLLAAAFAAFIATGLLAALAAHSQSVLVEGARSAVAAAPPQERSLHIHGPPRPDAESVIRRELPGWALSGAGYASGRQFGGPTGTANKDSQGVVYASVMYLDGLKEHARLVEGNWPVSGASQAAIAAPAARTLGLSTGSRVPIIDRRNSGTTELVVSGVFEPNDANEPFWLLTPELQQGSGSTYGPLVLEREDFLAGGWDAGGSAGWIAVPDLAQTTLDELVALRQLVRRLPAELPNAMGMGASGQATTSLEPLINRLQRADLVARSALLTPLLLIVVLGGYTLVLLAGLLTEQRRPETTLLRARGADRGQLAGFAAQEGLLVMLPAVLIAPFYPAALLAAAGCVLAMTVPTLRDAALLQDRPKRTTAIQRAGVDLLLVAFAVLAWWQLRQYSSPLAGVGGQLGIDPLLASAAPLGVLAASVVALRLLPMLTGIAERLIDRRPWFAAQLGVWQAGRRPHAGPVLLLALAVAVGTLAWALAGTAGQSHVDQANHQAGADLRLSETAGFAPQGRPQEIASLPGVQTALPAWRSTASLGERNTRTTMLALDAAQAADVVHLREDLGDSRAIFADLVAHRGGEGIPAVASAQALAVLHKKVGDRVRISLRGAPVAVALLHSVPSLPGTDGGPAILFDLAAFDDYETLEWWIKTDPAHHSEAADAARQLPYLEVHDRVSLAALAAEDPYGVGTRLALFLAAAGAIALALVGITVDVNATARRRRGELAVLHTLGATPRLLARALVAEQAFLAGLGVTVGLLIGATVAATMAPLVILTPAAARPDPVPVLVVQWWPVLGTAAGLLLAAMVMAGMVALVVRRRLDVAQLRIGAQP